MNPDNPRIPEPFIIKKPLQPAPSPERPHAPSPEPPPTPSDDDEMPTVRMPAEDLPTEEIPHRRGTIFDDTLHDEFHDDEDDTTLIIDDTI
ncbi:MAG: hypothetical protein V1898_02035 [Patescibacteria group bacterium]